MIKKFQRFQTQTLNNEKKKKYKKKNNDKDMTC